MFAHMSTSSQRPRLRKTGIWWREILDFAAVNAETYPTTVQPRFEKQFVTSEVPHEKLRQGFQTGYEFDLHGGFIGYFFCLWLWPADPNQTAKIGRASCRERV